MKVTEAVIRLGLYYTQLNRGSLEWSTGSDVRVIYQKGVILVVAEMTASRRAKGKETDLPQGDDSKACSHPSKKLRKAQFQA